jgi:fatty-acyl-CoA synthase
MMRRDARGHHFVVGRLHEVYRSGGENVYPLEVEAAISELPTVAECAVVAIPDETFGEVGMAVVVPAPGTEVSLEDITGHLRDRLARFKHPRALRLVDELPRNVTGKISRAQLRSTYGGVTLG